MCLCVYVSEDVSFCVNSHNLVAVLYHDSFSPYSLRQSVSPPSQIAFFTKAPLWINLHLLINEGQELRSDVSCDALLLAGKANF